MSKPEWGEKHLCASCGSLYYDMLKTPATCPKCGSPYDPEALLKSRRKGIEAARKEEAEVEVEEELEVEVDDVASDDDLDGDDDIEVAIEEDE